MLPAKRSVLVVGDGPARGVLESRARRLGIGGRVRFLPFVNSRAELARIYREAACVVDPAPHETFGLVVLEAAASGARVVACSSTPATAIAGGLVGTYEAKDRPGLAAAIDRALAGPTDAGAAARLAEALTWGSVFEAELRELERL
jgi:glycosyltransferase involved in cell wall biosynthesis